MITQAKLKVTLILPLLLTAFTFAGCSKLGTGVMLWPPDDSLWQPGELITVQDESFLRNTYIVNLPEQRRLKTEIDKWRIRLFRHEKDAVAWAAELGEWSNVFAECTYQGLPMRSEPANTASRVYRFRDGELIKVLGRNPGPVQVGNLEGYWYKVIAEDGVEGYVFDYYLKVMRIVDDKVEVLNARSTDNPVLDNLLSGPWRPKSFGDMLVNRQIDLNLFRPEFGLFPDIENKTWKLVLPETSISETWSDIVPAGRNRYDFLDTSFRITINSDTFISVQYNDEGTERYEAFVRIGRDINETIEAELQRRETILDRLIEEGPAFGSRAYGELAILEDGRFTWTGKSSLISRALISSGAGNQGRIEFNHFIERSLSSSHEGVLSLRFDNGEALRFLYAYEEGGLRLLYVPENAIVDYIVKTDQFIDPVRLFFMPLAPRESPDGIELPER